MLFGFAYGELAEVEYRSRKHRACAALCDAFNQMVDGLAERERLREAFGTYLDEEVAQHLISEDFEPHGEEVEVSLVFCDVRDFTTAAAESSASEVVARLNELFECIVPIVARHRAPSALAKTKEETKMTMTTS